MDARVYVYTYLLLSMVYAAACVQYLGTLSRTRALARALVPEDPAAARALDTDEAIEATRGAIRAVLSLDSSAFAVAVLPVAYIGVTGVLGNLVSRTPGVAGGLNAVWLAASVTLVVAHMVFVVRMVGANSELKSLENAVLSQSFVDRHLSLLNYYRTFVLAVTAFNVINTLYMIANLKAITSLPYVL